MSETTKKKYTKIGAVLNKGKGPFVVLGNENSTNEKYKTTVQIRVTNSAGEVVAQTKNGFLSLFDPRKGPNMTEEKAEKIPKIVQYELFIVEDAS